MIYLQRKPQYDPKMTFWEKVKSQISDIGNLSDHIDTAAAEKSIRGNIYFKGANVWILAFSIVIASVGLNVNSIPVIIGAMLISPLMGPIFGIGLGLGINDTSLLKSSLKNLLVMMVISLIASFLYFLITPLSLSNPTELLARTNPTIYDVLIALFGGFAGIFELCRKEKGTAFAGVAIATALMPPLCTAGFGLADGNLAYFAGALYLFMINCIFIILATYLTVKYMHFEQYEFKDARTAKKSKRIISIVTLIVIIPSLWSAFVMIRENQFNEDVADFVEKNKDQYNCFIYDYKITHRNGSKVEIFITGEPLTAMDRGNLIESAKEFGIEGDQLIINERNIMEGANEGELLKSIYERSDSEISKREDTINALEEQLQQLKNSKLPYIQITKEAVNLYPTIKSLHIADGANVAVEGYEQTEGLLVVVRTSAPFTPEQKETFINWLKIRTNSQNVTLYEVNE